MVNKAAVNSCHDAEQGCGLKSCAARCTLHVPHEAGYLQTHLHEVIGQPLPLTQQVVPVRGISSGLFSRVVEA